jgi:hypothetical protein
MIHIHLLQFKSRVRYANIVSELATWKINASIFILASIVENTITIISDICSNIKKHARVKNHYGWMTSWLWSSIAKKISQSYCRICTQVLIHLTIDKFSSSNLFPDMGGQHQLLTVRLQVSKSYQWSNNKRA